MNVDAEIERLKINGSLDIALLFSLFAAHPNQAEVLKFFRSFAENMSDVALIHPFSDTELSVQKNRFQEMLKALEEISRRSAQ